MNTRQDVITLCDNNEKYLNQEYNNRWTCHIVPMIRLLFMGIYKKYSRYMNTRLRIQSGGNFFAFQQFSDF